MIDDNAKIRIIKHLKENYKLPEKGLVAGQSVASLVFKELDMDLNFFINDVDVFQIDNNSQYRSKLKSATLEMISTWGSSFTGLKLINKELKSYKVLNSKFLEEDDKVNLITIELNSVIPENKQNLLDNYFEIINSFDLNCCCVGFDLETETFIFTEAFELFCQNKTLHVNSARVPFHTSLRLIKKQEELGENLICDFNSELECLFGSAIYLETLVGSKFKHDFEKYSNDKIKGFIKGIEQPIHTLNDDKGSKIYRISKETYHLSQDTLPQNKENKEKRIKVADIYSSSLAVHIHHINNDTGVFSNEYKDNIVKIKKRSEFIFKYLTSKMISQPLTELNLDAVLKVTYEKSADYSKIEKLTLKYNDLIMKFHYLNIEDFINKMKFIYDNFYENHKEYIIPFIYKNRLNGLDVEEIAKMTESETLETLFNDKKITKKESDFKNVDLKYFKVKTLRTPKDFLDASRETCANKLLNSFDAVYDSDGKKAFYLIDVFGRTALIYCYDGVYMSYHGEKDFNQKDLFDKISRILFKLKNDKKILTHIDKEFDIYKKIYNLRKKISKIIEPEYSDFHRDISYQAKYNLPIDKEKESLK